MGCDIHVYVEKKNKDFWEAVKGPSPYSWDNGKLTYTWLYNNRNYRLFSMLADVRNDGDITPLSEPKGLPEDVSYEIAQESEDWGYDAHSHSYFTLKELQKNRLRILLLGHGYADEFLNETIPTLEKLADSQPENIRIVFWFDS